MPPPEFPANIYTMPRSELTKQGISSLPLSLEDALDALEADPLILSAMGPYAVRYIAGKRQEWEEYRTQISQWELDRYLIAW